MKFEKPNKSATSEKEAPRLAYTSQTKGTSQISVSLSPKGPGTSVTRPQLLITPQFSRKHSTYRYQSGYPR